jgi:hypothetical protein
VRSGTVTTLHSGCDTTVTGLRSELSEAAWKYGIYAHDYANRLRQLNVQLKLETKPWFMTRGFVFMNRQGVQCRMEDHREMIGINTA